MDLNESGDPCAALYVEWRENERAKEDDSFMRALNGLMIEHGVSRMSCAFIDVSGEHEGVTIRTPGEDWPEDTEDGIGPRVEILPEEGPREAYTMVVVVEADGTVSGYLEELPGVISQGKDTDELTERMREAIGAWFNDSTLGATTVLTPRLGS